MIDPLSFGFLFGIYIVLWFIYAKLCEICKELKKRKD